MGAYIQSFKGAYKDSLSSITQNKAKVFLLVVLQLCLLLAFAGVIIAGSLAITEDLQKITTPLEQTSEQDLMNADQNQLLRQTALMYAGYLSLLKHLAIYTILTIASILVFGGWSWVIANNISSTKKINKSNSTKTRLKKQLVFWRRYCERTLLFVIPYLAITIGTVIVLVEKSVNTFITGLIVLDIILILIIYIQIISSATLNTNTWKGYFKNLKSLATKHAKHIVPTLLTIAALIALIAYILYEVVLMAEIFSLMLIAVITLILILSFARIYITRLIKVEMSR